VVTRAEGDQNAAFAVPHTRRAHVPKLMLMLRLASVVGLQARYTLVCVVNTNRNTAGSL
jgi:hypothetical protein